MPTYNIGKATASNYENVSDFDYQVKLMSTDGVSNQEETEWQNPNWNWQWGYFNTNADLKSAMLMKAVWNVGRGWTTANTLSQVILKHIRGWGKDTFDDIIFNMDIVRRIGGDSFAEIITDGKPIEEGGKLVNLKPLDPSTMKIVVNQQGMIKAYRQVSKVPNKKFEKEFKPNEIFHLSHNRLADQIHGISDIDALEKVIKAEDESFDDMRKVMHRQARPMIIWKLKTDDTPTINNFITKIEQGKKYGEDLFIPDDENAVVVEVVQAAPSAIIMQWRDDIRNKFYRTIGLPQVVPGAGGQSTESESKVIYLAFEQIVEKEQRYLEQQIYQQLGIEINFEPPASLLNNLNTDAAKDGGLQAQPSDITAGEGR